MIARFGQFELDTVGFRLMRNGSNLRLAKQPMDLLVLLIHRRGELVTREEIWTAWGSSTCDDSDDHRINTTIRKIRAALGDESASPKYIETIVRRGYRFIAPVSIGAEARPAAAIPPETAEQPRAPRSNGFPRFRLALLVAGFVLALVLGGAVLLPILLSDRLEDSTPQLTWKPITKPIHSVEEIVSDGKNVFWTEFDESGRRQWQVPIDGAAEATAVRIPFSSAYMTDASPDGRLLLVLCGSRGAFDVQELQGPVWELTVASGKTRRVGDVIGQHADWSPDQRRMAFARGNELWLANGDGSESRRIARLPGFIGQLHWSPDGKLLRFPVHPNTEYRYPLWEAETESGRVRPVLPEWPDESEPLGGAWTRGGGFVFGAEHPGSRDLWRLLPPRWPSTGHRLQQLTRGPLEFMGPVSIPGRNELAVIGARKHGELEKFDSNAQRFVPFLNGISAEMADFSRDGSWVAYVTYPERDLWRSRADGSEALQLTHGSLRAGVPRISPDRRQVAFTGDYSGKEMRTWLVPFDGGEPRPATPLAPSTQEVAPTWSPDGGKLLFRLDRAVQKNVLQVLDLASGKIEDVPNSAQKFNQRWSPDGKWFAATPNNERGLEVFNLERREWTTLTQMRADYPSWSRHSDYVYFCTRLESGEEAIYRVSLGSRKTERVTSLLGTPRAFNEIYDRWVGLAPDNSPLILRSADLKQIYLLSIAER